MAKDPAFLFYPNDWVGGTMHLNFECVGAYLTLLMMQFNRGHMTIDMIAQVLGQRMDVIWPQIEEKFKTDGKVFWNERLRIEKEKREKFSESRRNNKKGTNQHSKKETHDSHMLGHMTSHMENVNENENVIEFGLKKESRISIRKVYASDKVKIIYDLQAFFHSTGQADTFREKGWTRYEDFMSEFAPKVFDSEGHLFNAYRQFCTQTTKKGQTINIDDL